MSTKKLFGFGENYVVRLWIFGVLEGRRILRDIDGCEIYEC